MDTNREPAEQAARPTEACSLNNGVIKHPGLTVDWGMTRYGEALARQEEYVRERLSGHRQDTLVLTEHHPVFTIGVRPGAERHVVWDEAVRKRSGVELFRVSRGGDATFHGPGQLVGYPIVDLSAERDLHRYLRRLEDVLLAAVGSLGLAAGRREGKTGLWLGTRKIAALGVAVKSWVSWHGFALNVDPDLRYFNGIVPCGIADGSVTSLARELGRAPSMAEVKSVVSTEFWRKFGGL